MAECDKYYGSAAVWGQNREKLMLARAILELYWKR
jgi:hypothetical protein